MPNNDLQDHLNNAVYGTPKLKPDEQRKYLGTFRERVDLTITFAQINTPAYLEALAQEVKVHPDYRLIVNGALCTANLAKILRLAKANNIQVTTTSSAEFTHQAQDIAVVLAAKTEALHLEVVDVAKRYPLNSVTVVSPKKSFFDRFFN